MKKSFRLRLKENILYKLTHHTIFDYPAPINLSYSWNFGIMALVMLFLQIITGIFLAMFYIPDVNLAFASVEYITREVNYGYLIRSLHSNGASMFFIVVYAHILRGLYYGSYIYPRHLLWIVGVVIQFLMIITAFLGYVLPWGQMSYWGATVITNLVSVIPIFGNRILWWLWGNFNVDHSTLKKFFSLHFLLPFVILSLSFIHIVFLHMHGSNNVTGIDTIENVTIKFSPYYLVKDYLGLFVMLFFYLYLSVYHPDLAGHPDNFVIANPMVTPSHIVPEWYFLPYFAILRSFDNKSLGVILLIASILMLMLLPFINRPIARTNRPGYKFLIFILFIVILHLGFVGGCEAVEPYLTMGKIATFLYFFIFMIAIPLQVIYEDAIYEYNHSKYTY